MYKLLIADDEYLSRYAFRTLIARNFNNIEIIGEAETGAAAIEMCKTFSPEIVIMDIKMPIVNGLEASKTILSLNPGIFIFIVTAYDTPSFIQKALEIGAKGYFLKPINKDSIVHKLNDALTDITANKNERSLHHEMNDKIQSIAPFIQKDLISAIIAGISDTDKINRYLTFLQMEFKAGFFILASIENINENNVGIEKIRVVMEKFLKGFYPYIIESCTMQDIVILKLLKEYEPDESTLRSSILLCAEIQRKVKMVTGADIRIGIGNPKYRLEDLKKSYAEAYNALHSCSVSGISHCNQIKISGPAPCAMYPTQYESRFFDAIRLGDINKAQMLANDFINIIFFNNFDVNTIKEYLSQFITMVKRLAQELSVESGGLIELGQLTELASLTDIGVIRQWIQSTMASVMDLFDRSRMGIDKTTIKKACELINSMFYKDISLKTIADEIGISTQYLSKMFKEVYGKNFIEYLTDLRLTKAKKMLRESNSSINEISNAIGYTDTNYFCRIYKKNTGFTPGEYRKKYKQP